MLGTTASKKFFAALVLLGLASILIINITSFQEEAEPLKITAVGKDTPAAIVTGRRKNSTPLCNIAHHYRQHAITLVTGYFQLVKSKYSITKYQNWISNFLPKIATPVVIFGNKMNMLNIMAMRNGKPSVICEYSDVWELPPVFKFKDNYVHKQFGLDREKAIHSPELYAIWNSKAWMLSTVSQWNPFNSTYFFWVDIGCFRDNHTLEEWPDVERVNTVFKNGTENKIHLFTVGRYPVTALRHYTYEVASRSNIVIGGFFGGPSKAVQTWAEEFYSLHQKLMNQGYFIGKDQSLFNYLAATILRNLVIVTYGNGKGCKDEWFYFQHWYASKKERSQLKCQDSQHHDMVDFIR